MSLSLMELHLLTAKAFLFKKNNNMKKDSMVFYRSFFESISDLEDSEQLQMFKAVISYGLDEKEPELKGMLNTIFKLIRPQLDANLKKFKDGQKGAIHGKKGGRPKTPSKPHQNPTETPSKPHTVFNENPIQTPNDNDNVNVNVNVNVNEDDLGNKFVKAWNTNFTEKNINKIKSISQSSSLFLKSVPKSDLNKLFDEVKKSDFLLGKTDNKFVLNAEWILNPENFAKVINGNYRNKSKNQTVNLDLNIKKK